MQYALALASLAAVASAFPQIQARGGNYTTSTVYSTHVHTVTHCAASVTNCPAESMKVTTEVVAAYTTVCPVAESESSAMAASATYSAASSPAATYATAPAVTSYSVAPAPATATPMTPGAPMSYSVGSAPASAPAATGTIASVAPVSPSSSPIATGAGAKVGASVFGGVALIAAAMAL